MNIGKILISASSFLIASLLISNNALAADEPLPEDDQCTVVVNLVDGLMELPCVDLYADRRDENGDTVSEIVATYSVNMDRRGSSYNWEISFVELSEIVSHESTCSSDVNIEAGTLHIPCLLVEGGDETLDVHMMMSQRGNSSNWEIKLINNSIGEEVYNRSDDEKDDPCAVKIDLEDGIMELPCVGLYVDNINEDGGVVPEIAVSYIVDMARRGNSYNWEVTFSELVEIMPQESLCYSEVDLVAGTLHIPCLMIEGKDEIFEVYMDMIQHGNSSNWEILLINNANGEEIYYKNDYEDKDEDEDDGDCPDANANDQAKANHSECVY